MVFQSYALYPHMTVERNIGFAMRMGGMSKPEVRAKVDAVATILQLEELLDRRPSQLSGGQRQRVAIGRAIVRQPEVFLFDEPLSNLDAELRVEMRIEIAKLHQTLAATMIYVTHDQVEAMTLADQIVVLRAGRVEQVGSPLTLYDDPANLFVAGFIGSPKMNFLRAMPASASEGRQVVTLPEFGDIAVPLTLETTALPPNLLLGIRPEHFRPDAPIQLSATVDVIEHLGGSSFAYAKGAGSRLVIELRDNRQVRAGETLTATFDPARAFLFDRNTGQRLR